MIPSLRSSERGLKSSHSNIVLQARLVAPFVGAWIEIRSLLTSALSISVAPFVGAWIEMFC